MVHSIIIMIIVVMIMISLTNAQSITWTLPRANTQLTASSNTVITWSASSYAANTRMCISLIDGIGGTNTSITSILNSGSYSWPVASIIGTYQLGIKVCNTSSTYLSDTFAITGADATYLRFEYPVDRLSVTLPYTSSPRQLVEGSIVQFTIGIPSDIYVNVWGTFNLTVWKYIRGNIGDAAIGTLIATVATGIIPSSAHQNITWLVTSGGACATPKPSLSDYYLRLQSDSPQYYTSASLSSAASVAFRIVMTATPVPLTITYPEPGLSFSRSAAMTVQLMWTPPNYDFTITFAVYAGPERSGSLTSTTANSCTGTVTLSVSTLTTGYGYITLYYTRQSDAYPLGNTTYALLGDAAGRISLSSVFTSFGGSTGFGTLVWSVSPSGSVTIATNHVDWVNIDLITPSNDTVRIATKQETWTSTTGNYALDQLSTTFRSDLQSLPATSGYTIRITNWDKISEYAERTGVTWRGPAIYTIPIDVKYRMYVRTADGTTSATLNSNLVAYRNDVVNLLGVPQAWIISPAVVSTAYLTYANFVTYYLYFDVVGPTNDTDRSPTVTTKYIETTTALATAKQFQQLIVNNTSLFASYPFLALWDVKVDEVSWKRCDYGTVYRLESCPSAPSSKSSLSAGAIVGIVFGVLFFSGGLGLAVFQPDCAQELAICCCPAWQKRRARHRANMLGLGQGAVIINTGGVPMTNQQQGVVYIAQPQPYVVTPGQPQQQRPQQQGYPPQQGGYPQQQPQQGYVQQQQPQYGASAGGSPQYAQGGAQVAPSYSSMVPPQGVAPSYADLQSQRAATGPVAAVPVGGGYGGYGGQQPNAAASAPTYMAQPATTIYAPSSSSSSASAPTQPYQPTDHTSYVPQPMAGGAPPPSYDAPPAYGPPAAGGDFASVEKI